MPEPLIDIRPDQWVIVRDILRKHVPQYDVWAFGSRAKWGAKEYSDLDLAVIADKPLSLSVSAALSDDFSESDLPFKVDVVDWATTSESFRKIIERDKVVVWKAANEAVASTVGKQFEHATFAQLIADGVIEIGDGYRAKNEDLGGDGLIFLRAGHVTDTHIDFKGVERFHARLTQRVRSKLAKPGDAVITTKGNSTGRTAFVSSSMPPFVYSPHLSYWRSLDSTRIEGGFLRYWSKGLAFTAQLAGMKTSTDMAPYLSLVDQKRLEIILPPISEQRAIAHILGTLDDKIELNRRMNETLEAMARALFKSWFVDFDPVRAKLNHPSPAGTRKHLERSRGAGGEGIGLPKAIADLFPDSFEDSGLGEIPKGWDVGTLAGVASLNPESWSRDTRPEAINYVDLSNTKWGRIEAITTYAQQDAPSRAQRILRPQDTIVGTVRPGNGSYAFIFEDGLTGSTGFAVLRPRRQEYAEFVYLAATAAENIEALTHLADGGAYPAVRPEVVAATQAIRPSDEVLHSFSRVVSPLLAKMACNERESRALAFLRDSLLPKLISGELRVKDASRMAEIS